MWSTWLEMDTRSRWSRVTEPWDCLAARVPPEAVRPAGWLPLAPEVALSSIGNVLLSCDWTVSSFYLFYRTKQGKYLDDMKNIPPPP